MKGVAESGLGHNYIIDDEGNYIPCSKVELELAKKLMNIEYKLEKLKND